MIRLSNGYEIDFANASGAMAFLHGWPWQQPYRWLKMIRPHEFTVVIKTLTLYGRAGNMRMYRDAFRLYRNIVAKTWGRSPEKDRAVRVTVNRVGLTNMGIDRWIAEYYPSVVKHGYNAILSVMPADAHQADMMGLVLKQKCPALRGVEVNYSCPNVAHEASTGKAKQIMEAFKNQSDLPLGIKLAYQDPFVEIARAVKHTAEWLTLINTIPWPLLYPTQPSPFVKYGPEPGGVSGEAIYPYAVRAVGEVVAAGIKTPIMACGGINTPQHVYGFKVAGASAYQIGTMWMDDTLRVHRLIDECRSTMTAFRKNGESKIAATR